MYNTNIVNGGEQRTQKLMMNSLWLETKRENAANSNKRTMTTAILMNNLEVEMLKEVEMLETR